MNGSEPAARPGLLSKLPEILLGLLLAAILSGIVLGFLGRSRKGEGTVGLISFQRPENAVSAARDAGRPILYDFTAAWCGPCHRLDSEGWSDAQVAALVNRSYLAARVIDREREDGKNSPAIAELERRYSVNAFPTLVVAAADGRLIARLQGYAGREQLLRFLQGSTQKTP